MDVPAALQDADAAVQMQPSWPKAHYRRAVILRDLNRLEDARDASARAAALDPKSATLRRAHKSLERACVCAHSHPIPPRAAPERAA